MKDKKDKKDEILNKAFELGKKYEQECTGCAQTAVAAVISSEGVGKILKICINP
jgi:hypothetical protein